MTLIAGCDIAGHPVPDTAQARNHLPSVIARSQHEIQCQRSNTPNDPVEWQGQAAGLALIKPEINHVAHAIIGTGWRSLIKRQAERTESVEPWFGPGGASYVMVDHAVVDNVAGEAELPGTVAVLDLGYVEHIIRRRQTDPRNRRHTKERAGPQRAIALSEFFNAHNRQTPHPPTLKTYRRLFDLARCGKRQAAQKTDVLALRGRQTLEKGKQFLERVGLRHTVGIKDPGPVEAMFQGMGETDPNGAASAQVFGIANDRNGFREGSVHSLIGRSIVDDENRIGRPGLTPKPLERLLDDIGVVERVNVG